MKSEVGGSDTMRDGDVVTLFERVVGLLCIGSAALAALSVLSMLCLTGYSVFMRYVLDSPVNWFDELSGYLVVAIVMLGAAEALRKNDHIQVDLLVSKLKGHVRDRLSIFWLVCVIVLMAVWLLSAWRTVVFSYDFGLYSAGHLGIPMWIPQSLLMCGFMLVLLAAIARISRMWRRTLPSKDNRH